jgi:hypothetical protein
MSGGRPAHDPASESPEEHFRFGVLAGRVLRDHPFDALGHAVVDVEVVPALDGSPADMWAWLIFRTPDEAHAASAPATAERLEACARALLAAAGFPAEALKSFRLAFTSQPEIDAAGGRFAFFR